MQDTIETVRFRQRISELVAENTALRAGGAITPHDAAMLLPHINLKKPARYVEGWYAVDKIVAQLTKLAEGVELEEYMQPFVPEHRKRQIR